MSNDIANSLFEIKAVPNGHYVRVWRIIAGWFNRGRQAGWIAVWRTENCYYLRVWRVGFAFYKPITASDDLYVREWHWPKNVWIH